MFEFGIPDEFPGDLLSLKAYRQDFAEREAVGRVEASWKMERNQAFREPGNPSWVAFENGNWNEAMRLLEHGRRSLREYQAAVDARRNVNYRVRVVEEPITPYLQWELNSLRVRAELGERIRIVGPQSIAGLESNSPLPELITFGRDTLYRILYTEEGELRGGIRVTDPTCVDRVTEFVEWLYRNGEDIQPFFERRVARLPPPEMR